MPRIAKPFWDRVDKTTGNGPWGNCWIWTGGKVGGYGSVRFRGIMQKSHRVAWIITNGEIGNNDHVLHRCDNPPCCNPDHLFLGTNHDNVLDRHKKGRSKNVFTSANHPATQRAGEHHWCAKLSNNDVKAICELHASGVNQTQIAKQYSVHSATISRIVRGEWRTEAK